MHTLRHHPFFLQFLPHINIAILVLLVLPSSVVPVSASASGDAAAVHHRRRRAADFIYDGFSTGGDKDNDNLMNLTMDGQASVVDGLLRLSSQGHAFYPYPLGSTPPETADGFANPASFSATFVFSMVATGPCRTDPHGLAFVLYSYSSDNTNLSSSSASSLVQNASLLDPYSNRCGDNTADHLLAVVLDTVWRDEEESKSKHDDAGSGSISSSRIGIDMNIPDAFRSTTAGFYTSDDDGEFHGLSFTGRQPTQVWVDYDSRQAMLAVTVAPCCPATKTSRPVLITSPDESWFMPTAPMFAGFSSADGSHYILGWSFKVDGGEAGALNYSALSLETVQQLAAGIRNCSRSRRSNKQAMLLYAILLPTLGIVAMLVSAALFKLHIKRRGTIKPESIDNN